MLAVSPLNTNDAPGYSRSLDNKCFFVCFVGKFINFRWLAVVAVLVSACVTLPRFGVVLEDAQTLLFPFMLLALWLLPKDKKLRIPGVLVLVSLAMWLVGLIVVRAYYPGALLGTDVYLSRLENDPTGSLGRALYQRYNEIARAHSLPKMSLLQLGFGQDKEGWQWLRSRSKVVFLVRGSADWLRVLVPPHPSYFEQPIISIGALPHRFAEETKKLKLDLGKRSAILFSEQLPAPLVIATHAGLLNIPTASPELGLHFLAWFAKAFNNKPYDTVSRIHSLYNAASIDGPWRTLAPRAVALYYIATFHLSESLHEDGLENASIECALGLLQKAASYIEERHNPDTYAAIFNNAAVAQVLKAKSEKEFNIAKRLLTKASSALYPNGQATPAAKLAVLNMLMIERAGL